MGTRMMFIGTQKWAHWSRHTFGNHCEYMQALLAHRRMILWAHLRGHTHVSTQKSAIERGHTESGHTNVGTMEVGTLKWAHYRWARRSAHTWAHACEHTGVGN
jgi:hypothetical protein